MLNQIVRKILDQYRGVIFYTAGIFLYLWLIVSLFPTVKQFDFNLMIQQMPEYLQGFYSSGGLKDISSIEGFLSGEILSFFLIFIISFYVAGSASSTIAGAIEKRVMDFNLSQPISRTKLFLSDLAITIVFATLITGATVLFIKLLCTAYSIDISGVGLLKLWLTANLMMLSIYGLALLFSSLFRSKSAVVSATVGLTFGMYILTTLAASLDKLKDFEPFSLYHYYKPYELITGQAGEGMDVLVLLAVFFIGSLLALFIFNKKDI